MNKRNKYKHNVWKTIISISIVSLFLMSVAVAANCPAPKPGRMTGGGSVFNDDNIANPRVTHGFELRCDASQPNNLQVNWDGNRFHLETLTSALCTDDGSLTPRPPVPHFDTYNGTGTGRYNGESGYLVSWIFTDDGEPGKGDAPTGDGDSAYINITDSYGNVVLLVDGHLNSGNHQAH